MGAINGSAVIIAFSLFRRESCCLLSRDNATKTCAQHRKVFTTRNELIRTIEFEGTRYDHTRERRGMARRMNVVDGLKFCLKHDSTGNRGGRGNVKQCDLRKARDSGGGWNAVDQRNRTFLMM